jgi:hypothetical protein
VDLSKAIAKLKPAAVLATVDAALRAGDDGFDEHLPTPLTLLRGDGWTGVTTTIDEAGYRAVMITAGGRRTTSRACTIIDPEGSVIGSFSADAAASAVAAAGAALVAPVICRAPVRLGVLGAGPLGRATIAAISSVMDVADVAIHDPDPAVAAGLDGVRPDAAAAVRDATLIVTATNARDPVLRADWVPEGASIIAVGADRRGRRELDYRVLADAAFVACDAPTVARAYGDDLRECVDEGHLDWQEVTPLANVLGGAVDARVTVDDLVVVKLIDPTPGVLALARRVLG